MPYPVLAYELEADPTGEWIPMAVRMKLDLAGVKIRLPAWQQLAPSDRDILLVTDAETADGVGRFASELARALAAAQCDPASTLPADKVAEVVAWRSPGVAPQRVARALDRIGHAGLWDRVELFGRYVLFSLSRKPDDPRLAAAAAELSRTARGEG